LSAKNNIFVDCNLSRKDRLDLNLHITAKRFRSTLKGAKIWQFIDAKERLAKRRLREIMGGVLPLFKPKSTDANFILQNELVSDLLRFWHFSTLNKMNYYLLQKINGYYN
jgi:hypothetical protein